MVFNNKLIVEFGKGTANNKITYPKAFTTIPKTVATLHANNNSTGVLSIYARTKTNFSISECVNGQFFNELFHYIAIGF